MIVGDTVEKTSGDYTFEGIVVALFQKKAGQTRVVVENSQGILHIFAPSQLRVVGSFGTVVSER